MNGPSSREVCAKAGLRQQTPLKDMSCGCAQSYARDGRITLHARNPSLVTYRSYPHIEQSVMSQSPPSIDLVRKIDPVLTKAIAPVNAYIERHHYSDINHARAQLRYFVAPPATSLPPWARRECLEGKPRDQHRWTKSSEPNLI